MITTASCGASPVDARGRYDAFLFDLDGVLYRGDEPVPHAAGSVARLRASEKGVAFVTNNSSRTPEAVAAKLVALGVAASAADVETSALTTAQLLAGRGDHDRVRRGGGGRAPGAHRGRRHRHGR